MLAKQVLSQLSYTPTAGTWLILIYLQLFANSKNAFSAPTVSKLYRQSPDVSKLTTFRTLGD